MFAAHLNELGVRKGMNLVVHSRLLTFGRAVEGADMVYNALRSTVGPDATLVFPSYTLPLTPDDVYDPAMTPSVGVGGLSEYVRVRDDASRTLCPIHSHVAIGPKAADLMRCDPLQSLGPGSSFEWMREVEFFLLLLGCTVHEGATFVHNVEASVGVPYRTWLDLPRRVKRADGAIQSVKVRYYGRVVGIQVQNDLRRAESAMREHPACRVAAVTKKRDSLLMPLKAVDQAIRTLLTEDPFALTRTEIVI